MSRARTCFNCFAVLYLLSLADARRLTSYDAWATAPACMLVAISNGRSDSNGRLWGYERGASCAFKDEQQQALYPNQALPLQDFATARRCGEQPTAQNAQPDSLGKLWGVWWGNSCAFRTDSGTPVYYTGYNGKRYAPSISTAHSPSPTPAEPSQAPIMLNSPSAVASSASPKPTSQSPSPSHLTAATVPAKVLPSPHATSALAPSSSGSCAASPVIILNATAIAEAVAQKLWSMFSDYTNGYELVMASEASGASSSETPHTGSVEPGRSRSSSSSQSRVGTILAALLSTVPQQQAVKSDSPLAALQAALATQVKGPSASSPASPAQSSRLTTNSSFRSRGTGNPLPVPIKGNMHVTNSISSSDSSLSLTLPNTDDSNGTSSLPNNPAVGRVPSNMGNSSMSGPWNPTDGTVSSSILNTLSGSVQAQDVTTSSSAPSGLFQTVPGDEGAKATPRDIEVLTNTHSSSSKQQVTSHVPLAVQNSFGLGQANASTRRSLAHDLIETAVGGKDSATAFSRALKQR